MKGTRLSAVTGNTIPRAAVRVLVLCLFLLQVAGGCDLIRMKKGKDSSERKPVARVNSVYLYQDELQGMAPHDESKEDSTARITAYINSWIRKQLLMSEAMTTLDINEAEIDRKVMDYRYSLIGYEFQNYYIKRHLNDTIGDDEIEAYYKAHLDNFPLKQNIIQGTYIKIKKGAPRTNRIKELIYSNAEKDQNELKSYCLSFSTAYHLADSSWIEFDKLVVNSPLAEIPNKIQFLKSYRYYETNDNDFLYFIKIDAYKISDNVSPVEFVKEDIKNIILNKRKVDLARKLEDEVYENGTQKRISKYSVASFLIVLLFSASAMAQDDKPAGDKPAGTGFTVDKIIAKVDNYIVLKSDLDKTYQAYLTSGNPPSDRQRCNLLNRLVINKLLVAKAEIDSVLLTDAEVDNNTDQRISILLSERNNSIEELEKYWGKSMEDIKSDVRETIREQLLGREMQTKITKEITITPAEVKRFIGKVPLDSLPYYSSDVEVAQIVRIPVVSTAQKQAAIAKLTDLRTQILAGADLMFLQKNIRMIQARSRTVVNWAR